MRKYYDERATIIQKIWRGYLVRKTMKEMFKRKEQIRRELEKEQVKKANLEPTTPQEPKRELPIMPPILRQFPPLEPTDLSP